MLLMTGTCLLIASMTSVSRAESIEYNSTYGRLVLNRISSNHWKGTYQNGQGLVYGSIRNNVFNGHWIRRNGGTKRCRYQINGSNYWGHVKFIFSSTPTNSTNFRGSWYQCNDTAEASPWTGTSIDIPSERTTPPPPSSRTRCGQIGISSNGERMCCKAIDACCISCKENITVEEVCQRRPNLFGCSNR